MDISIYPQDLSKTNSKKFPRVVSLIAPIGTTFMRPTYSMSLLMKL